MNASLEEALFEVFQVELSAEYSYCPTPESKYKTVQVKQHHLMSFERSYL